MDYNLYEISTKVKLLRKKEKITQKELAKRCGLSTSAVSTLERNSRLPKLETVAKIASYFKISIDDLTSYNGNNKINYDKLYKENFTKNIIDLNGLEKGEINAFKLLASNLKKLR